MFNKVVRISNEIRNFAESKTPDLFKWKCWHSGATNIVCGRRSLGVFKFELNQWTSPGERAEKRNSFCYWTYSLFDLLRIEYFVVFDNALASFASAFERVKSFRWRNTNEMKLELKEADKENIGKIERSVKRSEHTNRKTTIIICSRFFPGWMTTDTARRERLQTQYIVTENTCCAKSQCVIHITEHVCSGWYQWQWYHSS